MYSLHSDFDITGYLVEANIIEPEFIFGREVPIYSATIACDNPYAREEILEAYNQFAGPRNATVEMQDQPTDTSLVRFESIMQPNHGVFSETGDSVQPGDYVTLQVRLEHSDNFDQTVLYTKCVLRSANLQHVEEEQELTWTKDFQEFDW